MSNFVILEDAGAGLKVLWDLKNFTSKSELNESETGDFLALRCPAIELRLSGESNAFAKSIHAHWGVDTGRGWEAPSNELLASLTNAQIQSRIQSDGKENLAPIQDGGSVKSLFHKTNNQDGSSPKNSVEFSLKFSINFPLEKFENLKKIEFVIHRQNPDGSASWIKSGNGQNFSLPLGFLRRIPIDSLGLTSSTETGLQESPESGDFHSCESRLKLVKLSHPSAHVLVCVRATAASLDLFFVTDVPSADRPVLHFATLSAERQWRALSPLYFLAPVLGEKDAEKFGGKALECPLLPCPSLSTLSPLSSLTVRLSPLSRLQNLVFVLRASGAGGTQWFKAADGGDLFLDGFPAHPAWTKAEQALRDEVEALAKERAFLAERAAKDATKKREIFDIMFVGLGTLDPAAEKPGLHGGDGPDFSDLSDGDEDEDEDEDVDREGAEATSVCGSKDSEGVATSVGGTEGSEGCLSASGATRLNPTLNPRHGSQIGMGTETWWTRSRVSEFEIDGVGSLKFHVGTDASDERAVIHFAAFLREEITLHWGLATKSNNAWTETSLKPFFPKPLTDCELHTLCPEHTSLTSSTNEVDDTGLGRHFANVDETACVAVSSIAAEVVLRRPRAGGVSAAGKAGEVDGSAFLVCGVFRAGVGAEGSKSAEGGGLLMADFSALEFVVRRGANEWLKNGASNFRVLLLKKGETEEPTGSMGDGGLDSALDEALSGANALTSPAHLQIVRALARTIGEAEFQWSQMTLMHRYQLMQSQLSVDPAVIRKFPLEYFLWFYGWARASQVAWLDWQRNYNTKPKDLSHATEQCSLQIARTFRALSQSDPSVSQTGLSASQKSLRNWMRLAACTLGRGGNQGQAIRDEILVIMHRHKISEQSGHFYEQWHQKLHNNTTPDDVWICEALIAFYERGDGNVGYFYEKLWEHRISRERLASYERPITTEPYLLNCDRGALTHDLRNYMNILVDVHHGLDMGRSAARVRHVLSGEANGHLDSALNVHQPAFDRLWAVLHTRTALLPHLENEGNDWTLRDLLLLDVSLESAASALLQTLDLTNLPLTFTADLLAKFLHLLYSHNGDGETGECGVENACGSGGLGEVYADTNALLSKTLREMESSPPHEPHALTHPHTHTRAETQPERVVKALLAKALLDRVALFTQSSVDRQTAAFGAIARFFGQRVGKSQIEIDFFVEEIIRSGPLFCISRCITALESRVRAQAGLPPWQVISGMGGRSYVGKLLHLSGETTRLQMCVFAEPTFIVCDGVNGEEEIPANVSGVIVRNSARCPDMLSHCAIRARNARVLLATCFDPSILPSFLTAPPPNSENETENAKENETLTEGTPQKKVAAHTPVVKAVLSSDAASVTVSLLPDGESKGDGDSLSAGNTTGVLAGTRGGLCANKNIMRFEGQSDELLISSREFTTDLVGGKSLNLRALKDVTKAAVRTPEGVAFPIGAFERILHRPDNAGPMRSLKHLLKKIHNLECKSHNQSSTKQTVVPDPIAVAAKRDRYFARCRQIVMSLALPPTEEFRIASQCDSAEGKLMADVQRAVEHEDGARRALLAVYASLFDTRPFLSLTKAGRSYNDLRMAVLCQRIQRARYAFVLHTANPQTQTQTSSLGNDGNGEEDELYGELVQGLGESLVGNYPGRALSWTFGRQSGKITVKSFFAKLEKVVVQKEGLIFRSDSNGEDLEGFAGAGLFDSVCSVETPRLATRYRDEPCVCDDTARNELLSRISRSGLVIEAAFSHTPVDVEGVVLEGDGGLNSLEIVIVQSRPQV